MKLVFLTLTFSFIALLLCCSMAPAETAVDWQLLGATVLSDLDAAQEALLNGANSNAISSNGSTSLHWATERTCTGIIRLLFNANANVNIQDKYGHNTPLHRAVRYGRTEAVKLLVDYGADIMLKDTKARIALDLAKKKNNPDIVKILEEYALLKNEAQEKPTKETLCKAIRSYEVKTKIF